MLIVNQLCGFGAGAAGSGAASPALEYRASYVLTADASSYTFSGCDFGGADAAREIFILISAGGVAATAVSSVTIGGVAASLGTPYFVAGPNTLISVARALAPSGAAGNVVVTFNGSCADAAIAVYRAVNRVASGAGHVDMATVTASSVTSAALTGLDVPAGGFVLSAIVWSGGSISAPALGGLGGAINASMLIEGSVYGGFGASPLQVGASTGATMTWTWATSRYADAAAWVFPG
ncbi:hypothetical protein V5F41_22330 [Xanthobacter autotrophicus]|uniref:hypothetical protein n=1 Tax=Xanthobacter autotrophicus TaxID=280 RepID=UPI00372B3FFB